MECISGSDAVAVLAHFCISWEFSHASDMLACVFVGQMAATPSSCMEDGYLQSNLQAMMPNRRPFDLSAAGSLLTAPSGVVPSDDEGDCADDLCGGAVLNCVCWIPVEDPSASLS
jgi:hypothetical protein